MPAPSSTVTTCGISGFSRKNAYSASAADLRWPNTNVRPAGARSSSAAEASSSSETERRVAIRSAFAALSQRSSRLSRDATCGAARSTSRAIAPSAIASCSPAKPPKPSFEPKRTTAALLTPTLRASESAVSNAASGMCSSSQAAIRRSFGERIDRRERMWAPTSTRPPVALATARG